MYHLLLLIYCAKLMFVKSRKRSCFPNIILAGTFAIYFAINISEGLIDVTSLTDIFLNSSCALYQL